MINENHPAQIQCDEQNYQWSDKKIDALALVHIEKGKSFVMVTTTDAKLEIPDEIGGLPVKLTIRDEVF